MPKPASGEVALAGADGRELTRLIREAKDSGVEVMTQVVEKAVERGVSSGEIMTQPLLNADELQELAEALASVNATADLLGRANVRQLAEDPQAKTFAKFADEQTRIRIQPPEEALRYFLGLFPSINQDPLRFGEFHRRQAFTLAASTNEVLTRRVQEAIAFALQNNTNGTVDVQDVLDEAGVSPANSQYAEMVFRTNAMDSYQSAAYEEARAPDLQATFPVWLYLGIMDGRQGKDHEPKFNRYYPAEATFSEVRGPRPFNCRCSLRWVTADEWDRLKAQGARVETAW